MYRPRWKTRDEARDAIGQQPKRYTKGTLIAMINQLQIQQGVTTVFTAHPHQRWQRDELVIAVLDLMFMCGECRGVWAHKLTCSHYQPCPRVPSHMTIEACPQCKKPAAERAPAPA